MLRRERKEREREKERLSLAVHLGPRLVASFDPLRGMLSPAEAFLAPIGAISTVPYSKRLLKDYA